MPKRTLKTYHGIPKTPIDDNTVFYASLDGTTTAEVGGATGLTGTKYAPMPTGLGYTFSGSGDNTKVITIPDIQNEGTIDLMLDLANMPIADAVSGNCLVDIYNAVTSGSSRNGMEIWITPSKSLMIIAKNNIGNTINTIATATIPITTKHIRVTWKVDSRILNAYADGKPVINDSINPFNVPLTSMLISKYAGAAIYCMGTMADISISNIYRGNNFQNLPKDFVNGYARIDKAFNTQRKIHSDALTSQYTMEIIRATSRLRSPNHTVTQNTSDTWTAGDTIKVKGLGGEIIGGVVDSDTALAKIVSISGNTAVLNDVSKLLVNDVIKIVDGTTSSSDVVVTAIDTNTKTITTNTTLTGWDNGFIIETTTSTSSPVIKFNRSGVMTTVVGTWTYLGTNEAMFTLGTNSGLDVQDLQIEYSLNMPLGQAGIGEVLTSTLGGETMVRIYDNGVYKSNTDFTGKVSGSVSENANIMFDRQASSVGTVVDFSAEGNYNAVKVLGDGIVDQLSTASNGMIQQKLLSMNVIKHIEKIYGTIPANTTASKRAWILFNVERIGLNWYGYGNCPGGRAYLTDYINGVLNSAWKMTIAATTPTLTTKTESGDTNIAGLVDSNGMANFVVYTDASDGVTASMLVTDYVSMDVVLKPSARFSLKLPYNRSRRRLAVSPTVHVRDDSKNKVAGSNLENPNMVKGGTYGSLLPPSGGAEFSSPAYTSISSVDGVTTNCNASTSTNGLMAQHILIYNVVEIIERKFGPIPSIDKIQWCKDNVLSIIFYWYGYGSCPSGNKAYIDFWNGSLWYRNNAGTYKTNNSNAPTLLSEQNNGSGGIIDSNGFANFIAYTDASNGTIASNIYTEYANIDIILKTPTGYDVLAPENPRRDDGQANMLFVKKETKEVQSLLQTVHEDCVATIGEYSLKQCVPPAITNGYMMTMPKAYLTTLTTKAVISAYNANTKFDLLDDFSLIDSTINSALANGQQIRKLINNNFVDLIEPTDIIGHHTVYRRVNIGKLYLISNSMKVEGSNYYALLDTSQLQPGARACPIVTFVARDDNGQLWLVLIASASVPMGVIGMDATSCRALLYPIPNKPLIK